MSSLSELAGRQLGPLPLGAWALAVAGGVAVAIVVRRNALAAPTTPAELPDPTTDGAAVNGAAPTGATTGTGYATNDEWEAAAVRLLIGKGYDPTAAQAAVSRWLNGVRTTLTERAMVAVVLAALGAPPIAPPVPDSGVPTESAPPRVPTPPSYPTPGGMSSSKLAAYIGNGHGYPAGALNMGDGPTLGIRPPLAPKSSITAAPRKSSTAPAPRSR